jgi:2-polyprenyl-3-methyl-5-hydroxy-6-metoxy-1,4-benzoquinol methylase
MKRSSECEMMDAPNNPPALLAEDLKNLRQFNRYLGGYRCIARGVEQSVWQHRLASFALLDVGTGSADIPIGIARWAMERGIDAKITVVDRDALTARIAAESVKNQAALAMVRGDAAALPFAPASFDFVTASQFLHHFTESQIIELLRMWAKLARRAIIVGDLVRHPLAYQGVRVLTRLWTKNIMTLTDAPLSVRRAFTLQEWRALFERAAIGRFQMTSMFPYRVMARFDVAK